jgi:hypothetical protein
MDMQDLYMQDYYISRADTQLDGNCAGKVAVLAF